MWNKVVANLIFGRQKYCRLCFCEVDDDDLCFHDEVLLNLNTEKISNMLLYIFGGKFTSNMSASDAFCSTCVMSVKNTYNFVKMCKDKSDCMDNILDALNESLKNTESEKSSKSVLIHIDSTDFSFMQFYQYRKSVRNIPAQTCTGYSKYLIANKNPKAKVAKPKKPRKPIGRPRKYLKYVEPKTQDNTVDGHTSELNPKKRVGRPRKYLKYVEPKTQDDAVDSHTSEIHNDAGTASDQTCTGNEENENNNLLENIPETQTESNLEIQHLKLKSLIQSTVSARSRKHILKLNSKKKPPIPRNKKPQTETQEPQEVPDLKKNELDIYTERRANILRRKKKQLKCTDCDREFVHKTRLINHMRLHSTPKPYVCKYCELAFKLPKQLLKHIRRDHFEPSVQCDICFATFRVLNSVHTHRRSHFDPKSTLYIPKLLPGDEFEIIE